MTQQKTITQKSLRRKNGQSGFTLVEMTIVTILLGLFIASAATIYKQWIRQQRAEATRESVSNAVDAITAFRDLYGYYPCPAPLTASRDNMQAGSATYGAETDCAANTAEYALNSGVTQTGVARLEWAEAGTKTYRNIATQTDLIERPRVRIGALPFRALNLDESQAYDGYNNRLFYAVTEQLTNGDTFSTTGGGIGVLNDEGADPLDDQDSAVLPRNSAHFIIFSAGEDGAGAYTRGGVRIPCDNNTLQAENCNFTADTVFKTAITGTPGEGEAEQFDDVLAYATHRDVPLWQVGADTVNDPSRANMSMKVSGGVGIGSNASRTPDEDLHVEGILRAQDDPDTADLEGAIQSQNICSTDPNNPLCFPSSLIAGDLDAVPPTGGLRCPTGEFMVGIKYNLPICRDDVRVTCPGGQYMTGVDAGGNLICAGEPIRCPTQTVQVCNEDRTLTQASPGTYQTLHAGASRWDVYLCRNDGTWELHNTGGLCECTPQTYPPEQKSCEQWWDGCGERFSGTRTVQWDYTCPYGNWEWNLIDDSTCTCVESYQERTRNCPSGYNTGNIYQRNTNICDSNPRCSGWIETSRDCACTVRTSSRNQDCPTGLTGTIRQERTFNCPNGSTQPGSWGSWTTVSNTCVCNDDSYTSPETCPVGQEGEILVTYTKTCPNTNYVETARVNNCTTTPPVQCQWISTGSGNLVTDPEMITNGDNCDCATEKGDNETCTTEASGGKFRQSVCICKLP